MIRINLIPPEYIERINKKVIAVKIAFVAVIVIICVSLLSAWQFAREKAVISKLAKSEAQLKELQKEVESSKVIEAQINDVQKYLSAIGQIENGRLIYTRFMQDIVSDLPQTMWFSNINTSMSGAALRVDTSVLSRSAYDLAYWINYLEKSGYYSQVNVGGINMSETDEGKTFSVPIGFVYTPKNNK